MRISRITRDSKYITLAVIVAEGIGLGYFAGYYAALGWAIFWIFIAWWSWVETMMERRD